MIILDPDTLLNSFSCLVLVSGFVSDYLDIRSNNLQTITNYIFLISFLFHDSVGEPRQPNSAQQQS